MNTSTLQAVSTNWKNPENESFWGNSPKETVEIMDDQITNLIKFAGSLDECDVWVTSKAKIALMEARNHLIDAIQSKYDREKLTGN